MSDRKDVDMPQGPSAIIMDVRTGAGYTALMLTAESGTTSSVSALIDAGANLEMYEPVRHTTALGLAIRAGRAGTAALLVRRGASCVASFAGGHTPFTLACDMDMHELVRFMLSREGTGGMAEHRTAEGATPLMRASERNNFKTVEILVAVAHVDLDARLADGRTALSLACATGHREVARILLDAGANDGLGATRTGILPLHEACAGGHVYAAQLFVAKGRGLTVVTLAGRTPMHEAARSRNSDASKAVELLAIYGAPVGAQDVEGRTPLHLACATGTVASVGALLARHAIVEARDLRRRTPLHAAAEGDRAGVIELLLQQAQAEQLAADSDGCTPLHLACRAGAHLAVETLCRRVPAAILNARDARGRTAMHHAHEGDWCHIVRMLALAGADAAIADASGMTPLHAAAYAAAERVLDWRQLAVADVVQPGPLRMNALHLAVRSPDADKEKVARCVLLLLRCGPLNIDRRDVSAMTPLHYACALDATPVIAVLLENGANALRPTEDGRYPVQLVTTERLRRALCVFMAERYPGRFRYVDNARVPVDVAAAVRQIEGILRVSPTVER